MCLLVQLVIAQTISGALKQLGLTRFEVSNASSWPGTILTWHLLWAEEFPASLQGLNPAHKWQCCLEMQQGSSPGLVTAIEV